MIPGFGDKVRLPRLGVIRLGEKRKGSGGGEYPAALDYFNLKDAPEVEKVYGKTPKELDIMFPVEKDDEFFEQALKAYRKSGLFCASHDGETATRVRLGLSDGKFTKTPVGKPHDPDGEAYLKSTGEDVEVGAMYELPCPYSECSFFKNDFCKPIGRLMFLMPKVPVFGCFQITTSSWNSVSNLNSYIKAVRSAAGRISMIPLKLRLEPQDAMVEGKKKTIHVLTVRYEGSMASLLEHGRRLRLEHRPDVTLPAIANTPDDLFPHAGEALDAALGKAGSPAAGPTQDAVAAARDRLKSPPTTAIANKPAASAPPKPAPPQARVIDEEPPGEEQEIADSEDAHVPPPKQAAPAPATPPAAKKRAWG